MSGKSKGLGRYLSYAFGEIILVVIGILIALFIKGEYEQAQKNDDLELIGLQIIDDLRRDTADVSEMIKAYEPMEKHFLGIMSKKYTLDSLKACGACPYIISSVAPFEPTQNGFIMLKEWKSSFDTSGDSLIHDTKFFYAQSIPTMELIVEMLKDEVKASLSDWRDNQAWYSEWVQGQRTEEMYQYMANSPFYRNKVANFYLLAYRNYLVGLAQYKDAATELADRWEKELQTDNNE
ncbi:MAG: hypothetical protein CMP59_05700 [Flavobacteriales bacterium]|nr:hypothetical protein [Flavobacteriales bacterium]|tara:strand:+ start:1029 stop:1736 length:708 start_codon:yes stop_codon:yes gene_type:complete